jgi:hypothetical protein
MRRRSSSSPNSRAAEVPFHLRAGWTRDPTRLGFNTPEGFVGDLDLIYRNIQSYSQETQEQLNNIWELTAPMPTGTNNPWGGWNCDQNQTIITNQPGGIYTTSQTWTTWVTAGTVQQQPYIPPPQPRVLQCENPACRAHGFSMYYEGTVHDCLFTPERVAEHERQEAERQRVYEEQQARMRLATERALTLLKDVLNKEQRAEFEEHGYFHTRGQKSKRKYRINKTHIHHNVWVYDRGNENMLRYSLCCAPGGGLPDNDCHVGQKLFIEAREEEYVGRSNHCLRDRAGRALETNMGPPPDLMAEIRRAA